MRSLKNRKIGGEALKAVEARINENFYELYFRGENVLDIGFRGGDYSDVLPIVDGAIGIDLDYPGYDGLTLPFLNESQDTIFVSHCLEHIPDYRNALNDWFRVLKTFGYLIITVPHHHLFERKPSPPSYFTGDHQRFYTSKSLLDEVYESLPLASFRIRSLKERDEGFDYKIMPRDYPKGLFDIELVIQKIPQPIYLENLTFSEDVKFVINFYSEILLNALNSASFKFPFKAISSIIPFPPYQIILSATRKKIELNDLEHFKFLLKHFIENMPFSKDFYLSKYPALVSVDNLHEHFINFGYFEGRESHESMSFYGW